MLKRFITDHEAAREQAKEQLRNAIIHRCPIDTITAMLKARPELADILISSDRSDDPNSQTYTALHVAVGFKRLDIITLLVEDFGANIRITDFYATRDPPGLYPLRLAQAKLENDPTYLSICEYLQRKENIIQLREAISRGDHVAVNRLIPIVGVDSNIAPHIRNQPQNYTALHYAVEENRHDIVEILLVGHGIHLLLARNTAGQTPLELAVDRGLTNIVHLMQKHT
ncbi:uncharacterized protein [Dysidea avara]|uniref:uncharacterized protein n=1 Tax=Dysidea avara TaxID=196820 RepID=UPI00332116E7